MDAFELLKKDHKKVSQLFKEIEANSGQAKKQIFSRLKGELDVHAHIEEKIFYPALENKEESRDITLEAYEEHKVVKDLLAELAGSGGPDDEWDAKLTVLKENVEHHVEEEEGELFSKARRALSSDQIEELGNEMVAEKASQQGIPVARRGAPAGGKVSNRSSRAATKGSKESNRSESPGVLKRLAKLVGLGSSSSTKRTAKRSGTSKTTKASSGKTATKKNAAAKGSSKTQSGKSSSKTAKKSAGKSTKASRAAGAGKQSAAGGAKTAQRRAAKKRGRSK